MWRIIGVILIIILGASYNNHKKEQRAQELFEQRIDSATDYFADNKDDIEQDVIEDVQSDLQSETYQDNFGTSDCTSDCSGHDAGYNWAAQHSITDPIECSGKSMSFIEGCESYANELQGRVSDKMDELESEAEDGEIIEH